MKILIACRLHNNVADDMIMPILNCKKIYSVHVVRYKQLSYSHKKLRVHIYDLGRNKITSYINFFKKTKSLIIKKHYDVLISLSPMPYGFLAAIANKKKIPMIVSLIGVGYNLYARRKFKGYLIRKLLKNCIGITVFGEHVKQGLIGYGITTPIKILPHGINLNHFKPSNRPIAEKDIDVLSICYLQKIKRLHILIKSIGLLIKRFPRINVKIVGKGPQKDKLAKLIKELELSDNITLCGYIHNVNEYYLRSKLFISLGSTEGVPFAIIKAIANGLPVIASDVGATDSVVNQGKNGELLQVVTPEIVAKKIYLLLSDYKLLENFSNYSLSKCEDFSYEKSTKIWNEIFTKLI